MIGCVSRCFSVKYKQPKHIALGVLKRAMNELNERADLTFRYEPIKEAAA